MAGRVPQVIVTLSPDNKLQAELPSHSGGRRIVPLRAEQAAQTLYRILLAQLEDKTEIGEDGAPTKAQVKHWEDHSIWPQESCRFCIAEGRIKVSRKKVSRTIMKRSDGVEVKRVKEGQSGLAKPTTTSKTTEELGL